jgi:uncharacterized protein (TIGR03083 family)
MIMVLEGAEMPNTSPWPVIHTEREALADDLAGLDDANWSTPSLFAGWSVREVLAHMTATAKKTPAKFFADLAGAGFRFNAMTAKDVAREASGTPADGLAEFRSQVNATSHPPGPIDAMLGEAIVHSEDIRRPLGISHTYPTDAVTRVADFYKGSNLLIGTKKRIEGLTLRATDARWSTGIGPEVCGPALSLVLVMTGREQPIDDLSGEGVPTLRART